MATQTPLQLKEAVVKRARELVVETWPDIELAGGCLYLTWAVCSLLGAANIKTVMLAGSLSWPRLRPSS